MDYFYSIYQHWKCQLDLYILDAEYWYVKNDRRCVFLSFLFKLNPSKKYAPANSSCLIILDKTCLVGMHLVAYFASLSEFRLSKLLDGFTISVNPIIIFLELWIFYSLIQFIWLKLWTEKNIKKEKKIFVILFNLSIKGVMLCMARGIILTLCLYFKVRL